VPDAGTLVTDVGSVKGEIARLGHAAMRSGAHLSAPPDGGFGETGWENATESLFVGRALLRYAGARNEWACPRIDRALLHELGAEVTPLIRTRMTRCGSYQPFPAGDRGESLPFSCQKTPGWRNFAGGAWVDTTPLGAGDPTMWIEILRRTGEVLRADAAISG